MVSFGDGVMSYFAKIGLDATEFLGGLGKADSGILQFYRDVSVSMGATMFVFDKLMEYGQKFVSLANEASEFVSTIDKLSVTTGMNNEELQRWSNVARYADSDISTLSYSLRKLQVNMAGTSDEGKNAKKWLDEMGVSYKNSDGSVKSMNELFPDIIRGLNNLGSSTDKNTAANALFGRGYQELAGYMTMSKSEMEGYYNSANVLTDEQQQKLRNYEKATKDLNGTLQNLSNTAGADLAPAMKEWTDLVNNDLLQNGGAVDTFFKNLDGFLTAAARGFHILGSEAMTIAQTMKGDFTGAMQTQKDLGSWVQSEQTKDALTASGYTEGSTWDASTNKWVTKADQGAGNSNPHTDETDAINAQTEALKSLTTAQDDYNSALEKMADIDKDYTRDLSTTNLRDVASVRNLNIRHNYSVEDQTAAINKAASSVKSEKIKYEINVSLDSKKIATSKGEAAGASTERSNIRAGVTT